jgi:hypothetical protein
VTIESVFASKFPGALDEDTFVRTTIESLDPMGFRPDNTLACLATCRDEISQSWAEVVTEYLGRPFVLTGLGGLILAGKTGFGAALSHAPNPDGRERYLFLAGPHMAVGRVGELGLCERSGRSGASTACGALTAVLGELQEGAVGPTDDPEDVELGWLRKRIEASLSGRAVPDLLQLTRLVHDVIVDDMARMLAASVDVSKIDYAVASGIQIHAPGGSNFIQPGKFFAVVEGECRQVERVSEVPK